MNPFRPYTGDYWPDGVPDDGSVASLELAYGAHGFVRCASEDYEPGFVKIALFEDASGLGAHAARLLDDGRWTSKLGSFDDIAHASLADVAGPLYGSPSRFMKKALLVPAANENSPPSEPPRSAH